MTISTGMPKAIFGFFCSSSGSISTKVDLTLTPSGRSTIAAIHDLNLAPLVADRALLLQDGRIGMDAPTHEVLESGLLDEVYRVKFQRAKLQNGRLVVLPLNGSLTV